MTIQHTTSELLDAKLVRKFLEEENQAEHEDPLILCKFIDPCGLATFYPIEFRIIAWHNGEKKHLFFGYLHVIEMQSKVFFDLKDLQNTKGRSGLGFHRDLTFQECRLSELKKQLLFNDN